VACLPSENGAGKRRIEWRNIVDVPHQVRGRQCLSLTFEEVIKEGDLLYGEIVVRFRRNLCGVTSVRFFGPDGAPRPVRPTKKLFTTVRLSFRLSLTAARYQDIRVLPPDAEPSVSRGAPTEVATRESQETYDHVVPDGRTVAVLTSALSRNGYYIKRVFENMPQPGKSASLVHRYWDIAGRRYHGIWPIDFHLTLTGDEEHSGGVVVAGKTVLSLSVQGAYTDQNMDTKIFEEWKSLQGRARRALESRRLRDFEPSGFLLIREFIDDMVDEGDIFLDKAEQLTQHIREVLGGEKRVG
jgi:hypothetical protein